MKLAPIALFVYNRLDHTKKTVESLRANKLASKSELFIFSDAPKNDTANEGVKKVREYIKSLDGFKRVEVIEREKNYGLAKSIISGVSEIVNKYGRVIVLEDDMVSSRYFLQYMNEALNIYEKENSVISINGYIFPIKKTLPETFFLKGADCWGWATWKRGWDLFEKNGQKLLNELENKKLISEFDFSNSYPYTEMLKGQIAGKNNSWAIRWYASAFLKNKLSLYPRETLIKNIGLDGSGTHCSSDDSFNGINQVANTKIKIGAVKIEENLGARLAVIYFFKSQSNVLKKSIKYLKIILKYVFKN